MTNDECSIMLSSTRIALRDLLTSLVGAAVAEELIAGSIPTAAAHADSICGKLVTSQATFDGSPTTFVDTQANIDGLDDVVDAYVAIELADVAAVASGAYDSLQTASPEV